MKKLILILLVALMLTGCFDIVAMELGRKKIIEKYPECADQLTPGDTLNCKQAIVEKEGKVR